MQFIRSNLGSLLVGIALGGPIAIGTPMMMETLRDQYDASHPVWARIKALDVKRSGDTVMLRLEGEKVRDCRFLRIYARSDHAEGALDAAIRRMDALSVGATRPLGVQAFGTWEIKPVLPEAISVSIFLEHDCNDRIVVSKILRVPVKT